VWYAQMLARIAVLGKPGLTKLDREARRLTAVMGTLSSSCCANRTVTPSNAMHRTGQGVAVVDSTWWRPSGVDSPMSEENVCSAKNSDASLEGSACGRPQLLHAASAGLSSSGSWAGLEEDPESATGGGSRNQGANACRGLRGMGGADSVGGDPEPGEIVQTCFMEPNHAHGS
jgi:hypothetical protein